MYINRRFSIVYITRPQNLLIPRSVHLFHLHQTTLGTDSILEHPRRPNHTIRPYKYLKHTRGKQRLV